VDPGAGLDVLAGGLAGSRVLELKRATMIAREYRPGFRIDLHHKDMGIAMAAARAPGWRCR
jgi:2-hydroxy-3-oxopropionate reductase